jgi:valyl-tRNA synthetase
MDRRRDESALRPHDALARRAALQRRGERLYQFVWSVFCDWYLELIKPVLNGADEAAKAETRATAAWVRDQIVKLLHPFMPFITEELWALTASARAQGC